jgi:Na+/H+ antiporter NhaD/arsenite permease-like protein
MVFPLMILAFVVGYTAIAMEQPLRVNKSASALLLAVVMWVLLVTGFPDLRINQILAEHLGDISGILFFLLGAMTIVELIDSHDGFQIITDKIKTTGKVRLLWQISLITFFLSAVLDNLTTAIIMVALVRNLIGDRKERWFYAGMVVLAANSGGVFSPIGDITTIMLWIGGQITTLNIILKTFIPSAVSLAVPLTVLSFMLKGNVTRPLRNTEENKKTNSPAERNVIFFLGAGLLLFVPVFKSLTNLPPYLGILLALGILWAVTEIMHKRKNDAYRSMHTVAGALRRIDTSSILFFLGILLAVAAFQPAGHLEALAKSLDKHIGNLYLINVIIGLLSAVIDNVPLVAGAIGMYGNTFPTDHYFWEMLAYCSGTGGSILIIGSAAGVAVMGMEKIDFIWYVKKISLWALLGYLAGAAVYWGMTELIFN